MAGRKLPALPSLNEFPASDDIIYLVDVSDTSESPEGTSKQNEFGKIAQFSTTFTPTISDQNQATTTASAYQIMSIGNFVSGSFSFEMVLDGGETQGRFFIDVPEAFEPANNFSGLGSNNVICFATLGGALTDEVQAYITDKKIRILCINSVAGSTLNGVVHFQYRKDN